MVRSARPIRRQGWLRYALLPLIGMVAACNSVPIAPDPSARSAVVASPQAQTIVTTPPATALPLAPLATSAPVLAPVPTIKLAQRVDALHGWALAGQRLRWTDDGREWETIDVNR